VEASRSIFESIVAVQARGRSDFEARCGSTPTSEFAARSREGRDRRQERLLRAALGPAPGFRIRRTAPELEERTVADVAASAASIPPISRRARARVEPRGVFRMAVVNVGRGRGSKECLKHPTTMIGPLDAGAPRESALRRLPIDEPAREVGCARSKRSRSSRPFRMITSRNRRGLRPISRPRPHRRRARGRSRRLRSCDGRRDAASPRARLPAGADRLVADAIASRR